jgi:hypothetical protein
MDRPLFRFPLDTMQEEPPYFQDLLLYPVLFLDSVC